MTSAEETQNKTKLSLSLVVLLYAIFAFACSNESTPKVEVAPTPCTTSSECEGGICVLEECRDCVDDAACAADETYGAGATCGDDGRCVSCQGEEGCACVDGTSCGDGLACKNGLCEVCPDGDDGCACFSNETCNADLRCNAGTCEPCPAGQEGCACGVEDVCEGELVCMQGRCVVEECVPGTLDCPCREGEEDRCEKDLTCTDSEMCAECTPDIEGCACDEDGNCGNDLVCDEEDQTCRPPVLCADLGCVDNQLCEDGQTGADARCLEECAEGFVFNPETGACDTMPNANCRMGAPGSILDTCGAQNRQCLEENDTARCGDCLPDHLPGAAPEDACRPATTCADLTCATDNRECTPHDAQNDASCGGCLMGFMEEEGQCVPEPRVNCEPGAELSILQDCTNQNRLCVPNEEGAACGNCVEGFAQDPMTQECVQRLCADLACADEGRTCDGEPLAECGGCLEGLIPVDSNNPESACRETITCNELSCEDGSFCVEVEGEDARCSDWPCLDANGNPDANQAYSDFVGECVDCGLLCGAPGETGRIWPFTLEGDTQCVCETEPDYFVDVGGAFVARPCDADDDGWTRESARSAMESEDTTLRTNARCDLRTIDRFVLENEFQQTFEVKLCLEGIVGATSCEADADCEIGRCNEGTCDCIEPAPVDMYEAVRSDDQSELDAVGDVDAPVYLAPGPRGRRLRASEINPTTRACISSTGDYNSNGLADIEEYQEMQLEDATAEEIVFLNFSHFIELHEGRYERPLGEDFGRYHIKERSRCDANFPVQYPSDAPDYWRSCTRNRDADYNRTVSNTLTGFDFARWTCPAGAETCDVPPPPTDMTPDSDIPPHGLCEEGVTLPPMDGMWRGMNHHSQFKCVRVVNTLPEDRDTTAPHLRLASEFSQVRADNAGYQLNRCGIECPEGDLDCVSDCSGDTCVASTSAEDKNPNRPVLSCDAINRDEVLEGQIGFAAVRFNKEAGPFVRGCISEWEPASDPYQADAWNALCPGFESSGCGIFGMSSSQGCPVAGTGNPNNFGKLVCGCGFNNGGSECEIGCAGDMVFHGGTGQGQAGCDEAYGYCPVSADTEDGGRRGWWSCGSWSTTSYITEADQGPVLLNQNGWSVTGEVPNNGIGKENLCQNAEECGTGWSAR